MNITSAATDSGHKINQIVAARTRAMRRHLRNDFSAA
jgi:hypothetical protein